MHTAFWVNIDPAVTAEEGNYLTHFCILPCLGRGRWMCQTWQWWLWAALCKHPGQLPVRLRPWLRAWSWQEELWRYSVLLSYWALKALRETLPGWNAAHFLGSVWAAWDPWNPTQKTSVVFLGVMAEPCSSPCQQVCFADFAVSQSGMVQSRTSCHLLHYSYSLKQSLSRRQLPAESCATFSESECLTFPLTTSDWDVPGELAAPEEQGPLF